MKTTEIMVINITPTTENNDILYFNNFKSDNGDINGIEINKEYLLSNPQGSRKTAFSKTAKQQSTHIFEIIHQADDRILCELFQKHIKNDTNLLDVDKVTTEREYIVFNISK